MKYISYSHQCIKEDDIKEVIKVLKSDFITQGPKVKEFEDCLCDYVGAKYAVAVSSGTAALHLAMLSLNVGKNDYIITSPITFSATANCALYVGAAPLFVDIDPKSYHMDINKLADLLRSQSNKKKIKVVIPVHFMGTIAEIEAIKRICDKYNIKIVEDAAHALGSQYKAYSKKSGLSAWFKVGGCNHSDISIFSFHPIKNITTGEGGAILTNNKKIYEKCLRLRHHGIVKNKTKKATKLNWFYDIPEIGYNYRITDFQCALGISQLKKIEYFIKKKRQLVDNYNQGFSKIKGIQLPFERKDTYTAYHLYVIRVPQYLRNKLHLFLKQKNIMTQINYIPVHLLSFYRKRLGYKKGDFPEAEKYYRECLSLPLYPDLTYSQQLKIIELVKNFLDNEFKINK